LVVEDEDAIRLSLRDFLVKRGYTVVVASDGAGAIEQLLDHEIDVIVSDYRMKTLGGHYWIRFLERFCPDQKVIIMSAYLDSELEHPFPVVKKPFDFSELAAKIESLLNG
jgi:DNA-binding response OmpR family regulator